MSLVVVDAISCCVIVSPCFPLQTWQIISVLWNRLNYWLFAQFYHGNWPEIVDHVFNLRNVTFFQAVWSDHFKCIFVCCVEYCCHHKWPKSWKIKFDLKFMCVSPSPKFFGISRPKLIHNNMIHGGFLEFCTSIYFSGEVLKLLISVLLPSWGSSTEVASCGEGNNL